MTGIAGPAAATSLVLLEHPATAATHPDTAIGGTPVGSLATIGTTELFGETRPTATGQCTFLTAVVDGLAGDLTRGIGDTATFEYRAATTGHPHAITIRAPGAAFAAIRATELLLEPDLATTVQRAFLATVVDGLTGDLTHCVGNPRALEDASAATGHPYAIAISSPGRSFAAIRTAQLLNQTDAAAAVERAITAPVVYGLAGDLAVAIAA